MAEFKKLVITNRGQALIAKMIAGSGNVKFTNVGTSSTVYTDEEIIEIIDVDVKQISLVSKVTRTNDVAVKIESAITNSELTTGYMMNTIVLYAEDPDEGEIVYAACGALSPGYMPPYNGISTSGAYFKLITTVGNSNNVALEIDPAAVATIGDIEDLQKQITELQTYIGYTENDIYGVEVDFVNRRFTRLAGASNKTPGKSFDDIVAFGGRKRCNITDSGVVVAYYGDVGYSETGALNQAITIGSTTYPVGTKVQVMVEQPKFYYRVIPLELSKIEGGIGLHMRKVRYYISDTKKNGFKLHPAFIQNGAEKNFIYLAAYEGCTWDVSASSYNINDVQNVDFTNDMLASIAGAKPTSGLTQTGATRAGFRTISAIRGAGFSQQTIQSVAATEILFLIEYASFDMQSNIGLGVTTKTDDGSTSMTEITGATTNLGNETGSVTNINGFNVISYRGEENFFGNIWTWIDGININVKGIYEAYVADNTFADNMITGVYKNTGITLAKANGYISAFGYNEDYDWLFLPSETKGDSLLPVGDYYYQNTSYNGIMLPRLGGHWGDNSSGGGFCMSSNSISTASSCAIGGRLQYIPQ